MALNPKVLQDLKKSFESALWRVNNIPLDFTRNSTTVTTLVGALQSLLVYRLSEITISCQIIESATHLIA